MQHRYYLDTSDIVLAATHWLIQRHRQTGQRRLAHLIEQHLAWLRLHAGRNAATCARKALAHESFPCRTATR